MELVLQKLWQNLPHWVLRLLVSSMLVGICLSGLSSLFHPFVVRKFAAFIDPASLSVTNLTFCSVLIVAPVFIVLQLLDPNRARVKEVVLEIDIVEAAMERMNLTDNQRAATRRSLIKALENVAQENLRCRSTVDIRAVAKEAIPDLAIEGDRIA